MGPGCPSLAAGCTGEATGCAGGTGGAAGCSEAAGVVVALMVLHQPYLFISYIKLIV